MPGGNPPNDPLLEAKFSRRGHDSTEAVFGLQGTTISHLTRPDGENGSAIDAFPQFLADLEKGQFLAVNFDEIAGLGVAACIAFVK